MQTPNDNSTPHSPKTETRLKTDEHGHIKGVDASAGGLVRATLGSAAAAAVILFFFWLPAEYGIDPTGVGELLGLKEMGEIKQQLYAEAEADDAAAAAATSPNSSPVTTVGVTPSTAEPTQASGEGWRDQISYTLAPTKGIEIKLAMNKDAVATYEWTANGAVLNFDLHGDGGGNKMSYASGRGEPGGAGTLTAAFDGNHGWFFRNRTETDVTFTLRTSGEYARVIAP